MLRSARFAKARPAAENEKCKSSISVRLLWGHGRARRRSHTRAPPERAHRSGTQTLTHPRERTRPRRQATRKRTHAFPSVAARNLVQFHGQVSLFLLVVLGRSTGFRSLGFASAARVRFARVLSSFPASERRGRARWITGTAGVATRRQAGCLKNSVERLRGSERVTGALASSIWTDAHAGAFPCWFLTLE